MISEKEQQFLTYWEEKKKRGRMFYSFKHGVLFFAWPVYLFTELFRYFANRAEYAFNLPVFLRGLVTWTILGFIAFGTVMWWTHEKQYRLIKKKESH